MAVSDATASFRDERLKADDRARRGAEWRLTWVIAAGVAVPSFVFGWFVDNDGWVGGVQGVINSLLISVPVCQIELAGRRWRLLRALRNWPFYAVFIVKTALYVVLIVAATEFTRLVMQPLNPQPLGFDRVFFYILIFASIMSLLVNAVSRSGDFSASGCWGTS
jgi:hypothetical protein